MENVILYYIFSILHSAFSLSVISVFSAAIVFLSCVSISAQNKIVVRIASETTIENDRIDLGKIAQISGKDNKIERLKLISLGYAPSVGMMRELTKDRINLAISAAGFSAAEFTLESPAKIIVRRSAQTIGDDILREAVEKTVAEQLKTEGVVFKIVRLDLPAKVEIPSGEVSVRADFGNAQNIFTPFSIALEIQVDKKVVRRVSVMMQIEAYADVLVAAKDLTIGGKVSASDVKIENLLLQKPLTNYLRNPETLRGLSLTKSLSAGTALTTDSIIAGAVIKIGDLVQVQAQSENLKIIINGEARANGKIGDRISVKNQASGAILQAIVMDEKTVKVNF